MKHRTDDPLQCYLRCSNAQATGWSVGQFTFHTGCLPVTYWIHPCSSRSYVHEGGSAGVLGIDEQWGGDEHVRQASACRHGGWWEMPKRSMRESKVVRFKPGRAAARTWRSWGSCRLYRFQGAPAHLAMVPLRPLEVREAMLARMRGSASPLEEARYFGSHSGSNFSLNCRKPWKL